MFCCRLTYHNTLEVPQYHRGGGGGSVSVYGGNIITLPPSRGGGSHGPATLHHICVCQPLFRRGNYQSVSGFFNKQGPVALMSYHTQRSCGHEWEGKLGQFPVPAIHFVNLLLCFTHLRQAVSGSIRWFMNVAKPYSALFPFFERD